MINIIRKWLKDEITVKTSIISLRKMHMDARDSSPIAYVPTVIVTTKLAPPGSLCIFQSIIPPVINILYK